MKYFILTLFSFLSISSFAQHNISGQLIDSTTLKPISNSNIILYLEGDVKSTVESINTGEFEFSDIPNGTYTLMISASSYNITTKKIDIKDNLNLGKIILTPTLFELEEVQVVGRRRQTIYKLDKKVVSAASNLVAAAGGNATDILSRVPSIRVDLDGNVTFRGSSGFIIHVNGKPSIYNATQALQQIPASQIENIEIISTPSARNQSDGEAGIINIITKNNYTDDFTGIVNIYGSTIGSRGADFLLNKRKGDNIFSVGGVYGQQFQKSDFNQEKFTIVDNIETKSISDGERKGEYFTYTLQAGWQLEKANTDYYVNVFGGYEGTQRNGELLYDEYKATSIKEYTSKDFYENDESIYSANGGFNHSFKQKGHTLSGYVYYKYGGNSGEVFRSNLVGLDGNIAQSHEALESEYRQTIKARLDYTLPYSETGTLEAGYDYDSYLEDGDYKMWYWNPQTGNLDYRDDIYNTFFFRRNVNTVYLMANQGVGKFVFQAGVRAEHTHQVLGSSIEGADRKENRLELFPSAHIGYYTSDNSSITAAYSRRTTRPQLYFMEPYVTFRDYFTAEIGNPDIRPEYIDVYELSFKNDFNDNSTLQVALFHRYRTDKIERLRVPYEQAGITLDSMSNVGEDYSTGIEFGFNTTVNKVWSFVVNGSMYNYKLENNISALGGNDESSINYDFSLSNNFKVGNTTSAQLDGYFVGPSVRTQGRSDGYIYADFAIRQQILQGKLSLDLTFRNFLNTAKYIDYIETQNLTSHTSISPKFPTITLGISYRFNSFNQDPTKRRSVGIFEGQGY